MSPCGPDGSRYARSCRRWNGPTMIESYACFEVIDGRARRVCTVRTEEAMSAWINGESS